MREENGRAAREPDDEDGAAGPEGAGVWRPGAGRAGGDRTVPADEGAPDHRHPLPDRAPGEHRPAGAPDGGPFADGQAAPFGRWSPLEEEPAERDVFGGAPAGGLPTGTRPYPDAHAGPYPDTGTDPYGATDTGLDPYPDSGIDPYGDAVAGDASSTTDLFGNVAADDGTRQWTPADAPTSWSGDQSATGWSWTEPPAAPHEPGPAPAAMPFADHEPGTPGAAEAPATAGIPEVPGIPGAAERPASPDEGYRPVRGDEGGAASTGRHAAGGPEEAEVPAAAGPRAPSPGVSAVAPPGTSADADAGSGAWDGVPAAARSPFLPPGPFADPGESGPFVSSDRLDVGFNPPPGPAATFAPATATPWPAAAPDARDHDVQEEPEPDSPTTATQATTAAGTPEPGTADQGALAAPGVPVTDAVIRAMAAAAAASSSAEAAPGAGGAVSGGVRATGGAEAGRTEVFPERPGSDGEHLVQRWMGTTDRADRFYAEQLLDHLNAPMQEFVARQEMFFLATADRRGECDATFRAGPPGFLKVLDARTVVFPEYRGNGVHASLGNISENPHVGLVLVDFTQDRIGLHVNGRARVTLDEEMRRRHPDMETDPVPGRRPLVWVEVEVEEAYVHCRKHIPRLMRAEGESGERSWGTNDARQKGGDFFQAAADNQAAREAAALAEPVPTPDLAESPWHLDVPRTPEGFRREAERALERARRMGGEGGRAPAGGSGAPDGRADADLHAGAGGGYEPPEGAVDGAWDSHEPLDAPPMTGGEQPEDTGQGGARDGAEDRSFAWFSQ